MMTAVVLAVFLASLTLVLLASDRGQLLASWLFLGVTGGLRRVRWPGGVLLRTRA